MTLSQTRTKTVLHQFRCNIHRKSQEELGEKNTKQESKFWCRLSKNYKLWHCSLLQEYASPLAINILVRVCSYGIALCCYLTGLQHFSFISALSPRVSGGRLVTGTPVSRSPLQPHALCAAGAPSAHWRPAATAGLTAGTPSVPGEPEPSWALCPLRHREIRQKHYAGGSAVILTYRRETGQREAEWPAQRQAGRKGQSQDSNPDWLQT